MGPTAKRGLVAALAACALGAAGCDGNDDGGGGGGETKALSKSDFLARADRACRGSGLKPVGPYKDAKDAARGTAEQLRIRRRLDKKLAGLKPPSELESDFGAFQDGTGKMIAALVRAKTAADRDQEPKFSEATKAFDTAGRERERAADRVGFRRCGQPLPASE